MFLPDSNVALRNFRGVLSEMQFLITEELRAGLYELIPYAREKISYGVPFHSMNKRLCFIWPTDVPRSGVKEDGVLLGFCQGHLMSHNTSKFRGLMNKIVRFVVYESVDEINQEEIAEWIMEAIEIDAVSNQRFG